MDRTPWPQHHPGSSSLVPVILPPPHPHDFPTADSGTPDISTQQIQVRGLGAAPPEMRALEDRALLPWLLHRRRAEHSPDGLIKHSLQAPLGQG